MIDLKQLQKRNYQATVKRGLITPETTKDEFIDKLIEEVSELKVEVDLPMKSIESESEELSDIVLVCMAYATHFDIDLFSAMERKVIYNENRKD